MSFCKWGFQTWLAYSVFRQLIIKTTIILRYELWLRNSSTMSIRSYLLQAEGRSSRSQGVVIFLSALAGNRSCEQGSGEGDERYRQAAWSIQEVRRTIFERCVAPSRISAFLQLLPPIFLCTHGSLEYNRLFRTPPCQIARISWRRKCTRVKNVSC